MSYINLEGSQTIYYNSFVMDNGVGADLYYEFYFVFDATPIYSSNEIVSYIFKPMLYWEADGNVIFDDYLYDINGDTISFVYSIDEISNSFISGDSLLTIDCYNDDQQFWFEFYDNIDGLAVEMESLNLEDYNLHSFMNNETFIGPYMPSERIEYITSLNNDLIRDYNELERVNEDLVSQVNNLINSQNAFDNVFDLMLEGTRPVVHLLSQEIGPGISIGSIVLIPVAFSVVAFLIKGLIL